MNRLAKHLTFPVAQGAETGTRFQTPEQTGAGQFVTEASDLREVSSSREHQTYLLTLSHVFVNNGPVEKLNAADGLPAPSLNSVGDFQYVIDGR